MSSHLQGCPTLVLNADFRPLSYFPLSLWSWQDVVKAVFMDRVHIISEYEETVRSPTFEMKMPSVIALKEYVPSASKPVFTRFNLFLRDRWTCQYCGVPFETRDLTFDHVVPRSKGGRTNWTNIVAACQACNHIKADYYPDECRMYPLRTPKQPDLQELLTNGRAFPPNFLHESWGDYLYWDAELID